MADLKEQVVFYFRYVKINEVSSPLWIIDTPVAFCRQNNIQHLDDMVAFYTGRHKLVRVIILSDTVILIGLSHFKSQIIT